MAMLLRSCLLLALVASCSAQIFGMGGARDPTHGMSKEEADHMRGTPQGAAAVDRAMQVGTHGFERDSFPPKRRPRCSEGISFASRSPRSGTRWPATPR